MDREIKFRVWTGSGMHYGGFSVHATGKVMPDFPFIKEDYPIMQFTGLRDRNGVEIYEGDILLTTSESRLIVMYQAPSFIMKAKKTDRTWRQFSLGPKSNQFEEVIGNVHENPELMK